MSGLYLDEWFLSSVRNYSALHMYELQQPSKALAWASYNSVCVACLLGEDRSELLRLRLPGKILLSGDRQDLCKERDFRVLAGGFHDRLVQDMVCAEGTVCCSEEASNCVTVWVPESEDTDLLTKQCTLQNGLGQQAEPTQLCVLNSSQLVHGSHTTNLTVTDLHTQKTVRCVKGDSSGGRLSGIYRMDEHTVVIGSSHSPQCQVIDVREGGCRVQGVREGGHRVQGIETGHSRRVQGRTEAADSGEKTWSFAYAAEGVNKGSMVHLSTAGDVLATDLRLHPTTHATSACKVDTSQANSTTSADYCKIQISPTAADTFSVSGLGPHVEVYTQDLLQPPADSPTNHSGHNSPTNQSGRNNCLKPRFQHRGHMSESGDSDLVVTNHVWHPEIDNLLLSCASEGGLHAWRYVEKS